MQIALLVTEILLSLAFCFGASVQPNRQAAGNVARTCCYPKQYAWQTLATITERRNSEDEDELDIASRDDVSAIQGVIVSDGGFQIEMLSDGLTPTSMVVKSSQSVTAYSWSANRNCYELTSRGPRNVASLKECHGSLAGQKSVSGQDMAMYRSDYSSGRRSTKLTIYAKTDLDGNCIPIYSEFQEDRPYRSRNITTRFVALPFGDEHRELLDHQHDVCH